VKLLRCALLLLPFAAAVCGCGGLLRSTAAPEQTYYLRAPQPAAGSAAVPGAERLSSMRVARPLADPGLDSSHITLLETDHRMSFYTGSRWPAPMPQMLGALAVQTLRASAQWLSVEDSASAFPSDYLLQITVRRFDAEYSGGAGAAPEVHVVLDCNIGRREGREVIGSFLVSGSASAAANRMGDVVGAFEQATAAALTALSAQAVSAVQADVARLSAQKAATPAPSSSRQSQ
jgi:cholesterol transport system auxiliary component